MKSKTKIITYLIIFLSGGFFTYLASQFTYFDIKKELDVPSLFLSTITLIIGYYIADTLQRRVNKNQTQHSYLIENIDRLWHDFYLFSESLKYQNKINIESVRKFAPKFIHPAGFLKNLFNAFQLDTNSICDLERKLANLENLINDLPAKNNIIDSSSKSKEINQILFEINQCFSKILRNI